MLIQPFFKRLIACFKDRRNFIRFNVKKQKLFGINIGPSLTAVNLGKHRARIGQRNDDLCPCCQDTSAREDAFIFYVNAGKLVPHILSGACSIYQIEI